jgi:predicted transcriptional regulator
MTSPRSIKLDVDTGERLNDLAKKRDRSPHWIMVRAVRRYLDQEERLQCQIDEAKLAWSRYAQTSLAVSHAQVDTWLQRLEAGQRAKAPTCR